MSVPNLEFFQINMFLLFDKIWKLLKFQGIGC